MIKIIASFDNQIHNNVPYFESLKSFIVNCLFFFSLFAVFFWFNTFYCILVSLSPLSPFSPFEKLDMKKYPAKK